MNEKTIWKLRKLIDRRKQVWRETLPPLAGVGVGRWSVQALELTLFSAALQSQVSNTPFPRG